MSVTIVAATTIWEAVLATSGLHWYEGLLKPTFSPTPWLAALASFVLFLLLVWAFFRVLATPDYMPDRPAAIRLFVCAMSLDALWSWLFFAGRHPSLALAAAAALAATASVTVWRFAMVDRRAGILLVPWALAAGFVLLVDLSIALRNG